MSLPGVPAIGDRAWSIYVTDHIAMSFLIVFGAV